MNFQCRAGHVKNIDLTSFDKKRLILSSDDLK